MTRRRRLLLLCMRAIVVVVVVLSIGSWLLSPRTPITCETYAKIHKGMPRDEVEALLGAPDQIVGEPLVYRWIKVAKRLPPAWSVGDWQKPGPDDRYAHTASWYTLEFRVEIDFDDNECVCGSKYLLAFDPNN
jgi:hypothetical protein